MSVSSIVSQIDAIADHSVSESSDLAFDPAGLAVLLASFRSAERRISARLEWVETNMGSADGA
jgi:hypothetical protein